MRILFTIGSLAGGGAERVVSRLSKKMAEMNNEIYVAMIANKAVEYDVGREVKVSYIEPTVQVRGLRFLTRLVNYRNYVKRISPDVVISFTAAVNVFVLQALRGLSVKVIVSERNNPYVDPIEEKSRKKRDTLYKKANGYVFQTEDARGYFPLEIQSKGIIILNPIEDSVPHQYIGVREKRIVTVGRLEKQKNQKMLIDAFAHLHEEYDDYHLQIYGSGSLEEDLRERIAGLGLHNKVHLMGHDKDVLNKISSAALFVLPSDYEGISNALLEAMAMGMPIVSTDHPIGGARMLVENGVNGLLVPVGDPIKLADAMKIVLSDRDKTQLMSIEAAKIRHSTSIDTITSQWISYIHRVLNNEK